MEVIELRYPFETVVDFYKQGYWLDPRALHLLTGQALTFLALIYFSARHFRKFPTVITAATFATSFMINPAMSIAGLFISDWLLLFTGIFACFSYLGKSSHYLAWWILGFLILIAAHSLLVFKIYDLGGTDQFAQRLILVGRPIAVFFTVCFSLRLFKDGIESRLILKQMIFTMLLISSLTYLVQYSVFKSGITPFGTFASAGFGGGVRFGGLANEGGHLSKLSFAPLILAILMSEKYSDVILVCLFISTFLMNPSASGYAFFTTFVLVSLIFIFCRTVRFRRWKTLFLFTLSGVFSAGLIVAGLLTSPVLSGLGNKISDSIHVMNNPDKDIYGRSPLIAAKILKQFPLGVGFGGSTQRNLAAKLVGIKFGESNLGINVLIESLSFLSVVPIMFILFSATRLSREAFLTTRHSILKGSLLGAAGWAILAVLFLDVLFVIPQLWILFFYVSEQFGRGKSHADF